jgi:two-component system, chemotaxis family, protein-glutamate methylesterase/glutaminase
MKPVRVLVVDDSATMRGMIAALLSSDPGITVVGEASNPLEARDAIKALNPDVITLDVEMPKMDGLEFLDKIMRLRPMPVIMVSTLTSKGAAATIKALEIGALDCVAKPSPENRRSFEELPGKVKMAANTKPRPRGNAAAAAQHDTRPGYEPDGHLVAIGASTGGVEALIAILTQFPRNCPPTVVTLHMPSPFTTTFAQRLDRLCAPKVTEATDGTPIVPGQIFLAPGGAAHLEVTGSSLLRCHLRVGDLVGGHRPSVDVLFNSVARTCRAGAMGVILTGMGRDGAAGLLAMRRAGAQTIGQTESTCVVYGMPKVAFEMGAVEKQVPLNKIGAEILSARSARD